MDNLTHSLVGFGVGQAAWLAYSKTEKSNSSRLQGAFWLASIAGNNLPDLDVFYSRALGGQLGGLLHHRGHTHTLIAAVPIAILLTLLFKLFNRRLKTKDLLVIFSLGFFGTWLHIGMDYLNSYGVHPFWPFSSRWVYGDTLFIIEPLIWMSLLPLAFREVTHRASKTFILILMTVALGLVWLTGYVPFLAATFTTLWGLWLLGWMHKTPPSIRVASTLAATAAIVLVFGIFSNRGAAQVRALLTKDLPQAKIEDVVLSPFPANPLCWQVQAILTDSGTYRVSKGIYAPSPATLGAAECGDSFLSGETSAPLKKPTLPLRPELLWTGEFQAPLQELQTLTHESCLAQAALQFIRVPVWNLKTNPAFLGDLRFDRSPKKDFTDFEISRPSANPCPTHLPPWIAPRAALLQTL